MKKRHNYNSGILHVYEEKELKTDFNAKKNAKSIDDLRHVVKLAFTELSCRQQDYAFAEQMGTKLTMKVVTPYVQMVRNRHKVVIDGYLYDITHVDPDADKRELYIYLEGAREIAE